MGNLAEPMTDRDVVARQEALRLDFAVSLNEEHVTLQVATRLASIALGERTHHYSVLALARHRLRDADRGLDLSSQGWIETAALAHSLGIDEAHLNIHIFRARTQFRQAIAATGQAPELIERRRRELRIGSLYFQIMRGSALEGCFWPPAR
jgi:hypothetical protein